MSLSRARVLLIGRLRRRKTRQREAKYLAEGIRCANEVLQAGATVRFGVVSGRLHELHGGSDLAARLESSAELFEVTDAELAALADTEAPQGVLLICEAPPPSLKALADHSHRLVLADGIQDPGNLGTLVRSAAAFGASAVVAMEGTVDPWNPKAVRASAGSIARLRVATARWDAVEAFLGAHRVAVLAAHRGGRDIASLDPPERWALAVGSEGSGLRTRILDAARERVAIPMPGGVDSLNAATAGSILLYALCRGGRRRSDAAAEA